MDTPYRVRRGLGRQRKKRSRDRRPIGCAWRVVARAFRSVHGVRSGTGRSGPDGQCGYQAACAGAHIATGTRRVLRSGLVVAGTDQIRITDPGLDSTTRCAPRAALASPRARLAGRRTSLRRFADGVARSRGRSAARRIWPHPAQRRDGRRKGRGFRPGDLCPKAIERFGAREWAGWFTASARKPSL